MAKIENPALKDFVASIGNELVLAQVIILRGRTEVPPHTPALPMNRTLPSPQPNGFPSPPPVSCPADNQRFALRGPLPRRERRGSGDDGFRASPREINRGILSPDRSEGDGVTGYELRHIDDAAVADDSLRVVNLNDIRILAQSTASGEFRPLKSAPTLQRGWRLVVADDAGLEAALSRLYPGAVADWHMARSANPPVTNYREYANRQSGMFRVTAKLSDAQAVRVIESTCNAKFCLKRRLWTVAGFSPDPVAGKSLIPCLEPCAVLMEAARRAFRAEQPENPAMKLAAEAEAG